MKQSEYLKIRVTVPEGNVDDIRDALAKAGVGEVGNYSHCSFVYPVRGRFKPNDEANPAIGNAGEIEEVDEYMVEAICHEDKVEGAVKALIEAHPYEEPAIDIMPRLEI